MEVSAALVGFRYMHPVTLEKLAKPICTQVIVKLQGKERRGRKLIYQLNREKQVSYNISLHRSMNDPFFFINLYPAIQ